MALTTRENWQEGIGKLVEGVNRAIALRVVQEMHSPNTFVHMGFVLCRQSQAKGERFYPLSRDIGLVPEFKMGPDMGMGGSAVRFSTIVTIGWEDFRDRRYDNMCDQVYDQVLSLDEHLVHSALESLLDKADYKQKIKDRDATIAKHESLIKELRWELDKEAFAFDNERAQMTTALAEKQTTITAHANNMEYWKKECWKAQQAAFGAGLLLLIAIAYIFIQAVWR